MAALQDLAEAAQCLGQRHVAAGHPGERFGDEERLGEEALHPPRPVDCLAVLLAQFLHPQDGDHVL